MSGMALDPVTTSLALITEMRTNGRTHLLVQMLDETQDAGVEVAVEVAATLLSIAVYLLGEIEQLTRPDVVDALLQEMGRNFAEIPPE